MRLAEVPRPDQQESSESRERPLRGKVAVITGSSRGIGAKIANSLAMAGCDIVGNHVDPSDGKVRRQERVDLEIQSYGVEASSVLADITEPEGRLALLQKAIMTKGATEPRKIDYLILNAAGGLEERKPERWAEKINIEAQLALVEEFLPYMNEGGAIIYITSLWAHRYGKVKELPSYGPVARTKNTAERLLREKIPQFNARSISLGIVCGHFIKGTGAYIVFKKKYPEELKQLEQYSEGGVFKDASDMGEAVKDMIVLGFRSGDTKYVGGTNTEPLDPVFN